MGLQSCFLFEKKDAPVDPVKEDPLPSFVTEPDRYPIPLGIMDEASGIVASTSEEGGVWVIQDGNRPTELHLLSTTGDVLGKLNLPFANRDWEDLAKGLHPENQEPYLLVGEIGDNAEVYPEYNIYRFDEPKSLRETVSNVETIEFVYSDGLSHDAEALFAAPNGDIYVVTKRELNVKVFKLSYPQNTQDRNTAELLGRIPLWFITAGDISLDGKEILLKNPEVIYYWRLQENETIFEALSRGRDVSPTYQPEAQGEGLCFDVGSNGFYTLSERPDGQTEPVSLNYHAKIIAD